MSKFIKMTVVALFGLGCSAPFEAADFEGAGGDDSEAGAPASAGHPAEAGAHSGGSSTSGGAPSPSAGQAADAGAPAVSCEFDESKLTAALPTALVWKDFTSASGEACVVCRDTPCRTIGVTSWGTPTAVGPKEGYPEHSFSFTASIDRAMVPVTFGTSASGCTGELECGAKPVDPGVTLTVARVGAAWQVTAVKAYAAFESNACFQGAGGLGSAYVQMGEDLTAELEASLKGLKIPCAE